MPPKFTADALQSKYGGELEQPPFGDAATPRMLEAKYEPELGRPPLSDAQTPRVFFHAVTDMPLRSVEHKKPPWTKAYTSSKRSTPQDADMHTLLGAASEPEPDAT